MPLIQVDRSRCDAWLIDCKWPLRDINNKPAWTNCRALWPNYSCHEIIYLQHCLELVMLVYTRITHFRQCCNYNLLPAMYGRVLSLLSVRFFGYIISRRRWHRSAWNFARWYVSRIIDVSSPLLGEVPPWDPQIQNPVWRVLCFSNALVILPSHSLLPFTSLTLSLSSIF